MPAVVVLVGAAASGKTMLRRRLVAAGLEERLVVSLDDERERLRAEHLARGLPERPLQEHSLPALRRAARRQQALLRAGRGYLADATHLRRRERRLHLTQACTAGLPARALLLPAVDLDALVVRNATRPEHRQVPLEVLARHAHRRRLLGVDMLAQEGFDEVRQVTPDEPVEVRDAAAPQRLHTQYGALLAHVHERAGATSGAVLVGGIGDDVDGRAAPTSPWRSGCSTRPRRACCACPTGRWVT